MANKNKPNVLFWIIVLTVCSAFTLLIYSLILILGGNSDLYDRTNLGNILGVITSILILISCFVFLRNHYKDLYGSPGKREYDKNDRES